MKLSVAIIAIALGGCAHVTRSTPEALIASPGSFSQIQSALDFDSAYRKTLHQMKSCYEFGGAYMTHMSVYGDKTKEDGMISFAVIGITGHKVMATIRLKPNISGTQVDLYSATESPPKGIISQIDFWLNRGGEGCQPQESTTTVSG